MLNGTSGAGPSHMFQSRPDGGDSLGGLPRPSESSFIVLKVVTEVILPSAPERTMSTHLWYSGVAWIWVPTWVIRLYRRAKSAISLPSPGKRHIGFSQRTSLPASRAARVTRVCQCGGVATIT